MMICIALPVLNEKDRLQRGVMGLIDFARVHAIPIEIQIADNGSTDETPEIAQKLISQHPNIRLLRLPEKGVGRALKAAWQNTECEYVGYMDIDLATDLKHLLQVHELVMSNADVINGSRLLPGSSVTNRSLVREISSRSFNKILQLRLGVKFTDGMCGFKFLKRSIFLEILQRYSPLDNGWFFNTEVLVKSEWLGKKVQEIPVNWSDDRNSRVKLFKLSREYLQQIERVRKQRPHDGI